MYTSDVFGEIAHDLSFSNILSFRTLAFCVAIVLGGILYGHALIPLNNLRGPWISRLFPLQDWQGRHIRGKYLMHLHQRYGLPHAPPGLTYLGAVIRIGPSLLSVQGTEAIHAIYGAPSKWTKPSQGSKLGVSQITSHGCLYTAKNLGDVKSRGILEPCFTSEAVAAQQHVILNCADTALTVTEIACENDGGKVDVLQIARTYAFDAISPDSPANELMVAEILYGGSWQGRGTHSERKAHLKLLDQAMESSVSSLRGAANLKWLTGWNWLPKRLRPVLDLVAEQFHLTKANETAYTELEKVQTCLVVVNMWISAESIKAYHDDHLCKPGSSRGCIASLIESKDIETTRIQTDAFTVRFMPLLAAG